MRICTSFAPALRIMRTIFRLVVPRTIESSISTTRLPSSRLRTGIQLQLHSEVAHALPRLDERPSHIVITDQPEAKRNAALGRVTHGRGHAGVRHRNHDVGIDRSFARQLPSQFFAALLHRTPEHQAVRTREIHVLEDAARLRQRGSIKARRNPLRTDDDQFSRLHIALVSRRRSDRTRRSRKRTRWCPCLLAALRRNPSHRQRPKAARIARRKDPVRTDHHQRERAFHAAQRIGHRFGQRLLFRQRDQMHDHFGIAVGLEDRPLCLPAAAGSPAHSPGCRCAPAPSCLYSTAP